MLSYSTRNQPVGAKVAYWNTVISDVFAPLETVPSRIDHFDAEIRATQAGSLMMANAVSLPARVTRRPAPGAKPGEQPFFLHTQLQGALTLRQDGREATIGEGDMVLSDSALPYTLSYDQPCSTLVMIVPAAEMRRRLTVPEAVIGVGLSGQEGLFTATSQLLRSVWQQTSLGIDAEVGSILATSLLDMFGAACIVRGGGTTGASANRIAWRLRIRRFVEQRLADPDLSPRMVAATFGISPRYLHGLFAGEAESFSAFVLRRRIEECARKFADPMWQGRSITEIAFAWGFNNATHFARVFRDSFGMSPRDYRASRPEALH